MIAPEAPIPAAGRWGVLLLAFGGPDSPGAVEPFMTELAGGRQPSPAAVARAREKYRSIGGRSPLLTITLAQAAALEAELNASPAPRCRVYVGTRYWRPTIPEALRQMVTDGVRQAVAVSLAPHRSRVSTGAYEDGVAAALAELQPGPLPAVTHAPDWYNHPLFIEALVEKLVEGLGRFPADRRAGVEVVFTAHSLPVSYIREGDPYLDQLRATVKALVDRVGVSWHLAFQSRGGGQQEWLGPEAGEVLADLAARRRRDVLLVPIGFVADHVETLYDIDIALAGRARDLGLDFRRTDSLNTSATFIRALATVVRESLDQGWREAKA